LWHGVTAYKFYTHQDLERVAFLRAINPVEADTFRVSVVQDFDGVAIEDGNGLACKAGKGEVESIAYAIRKEFMRTAL
jgi:hypothetical protein